MILQEINCRKDIEYDLILAYAGGQYICQIPNDFIDNIDLKFNDLSSITLTVPKIIDNKFMRQDNKFYDELTRNKILILQFKGSNIKYKFFIEQDPKENDKGNGDCIKNFIAYTIEKRLDNRLAVTGECEAKPIISKQGDKVKGILNYFEEQTRWKIGYVDENAIYETINGKRKLKYRWFDVVNDKWRRFLKETCSVAFECLFIFDGDTMTVNVYSEESIGEKRNLYLSVNKHILSMEKDCNVDCVTRLKLTGKDGITINEVNPLGTDYIENFDGVKKDMSIELSIALEKYEKIVSNNFEIWKERRKELIKCLKEKDICNQEILKYKEQIDGLTALITNYENTNDSENLSRVQGEIDVTENKKDEQEKILNNINEELSKIYANINKIIYQNDRAKCVDELGRRVFNDNLLNELDFFIQTDSYDNSTFFTKESLYQAGLKELKKRQEPEINYTCDMTNFLKNLNYLHWNNTLALGDFVVINSMSIGQYDVRVNEIKIEPKNKKFGLTFSNKPYLYKQIKLNALAKANKSNIILNHNKNKWDNDIKKTKVFVDDIKRNGLNLANIDVKGEGFSINKYGIEFKGEKCSTVATKDGYSLINKDTKEVKRLVNDEGVCGEAITSNSIKDEQISKNTKIKAGKLDIKGIIKAINFSNKAHVINVEKIGKIDEKIKDSAKEVVVDAINANEANVKHLIADKIDANEAHIKNLIADKADIKDLHAINAYIEHLKADTIEAINAKIKYLEAEKANIHDLTAINANIENLKATKAEIKDLHAIYAKIDTLDADKANINQLQAIEADIKHLRADKADINELNAIHAKINTLEADKADVKLLNAQIANIKTLTADLANIKDLTAKQATIDLLNATKANILEIVAQKISTKEFNAEVANIQHLITTKADIKELKAQNAYIEQLVANVANIKHILAGNITADNIATGAITANSGIIAEGAIGDAQISSISANKISSGDIDTSLVNVVSKDNVIRITGNQIMANDVKNPLKPVNRVIFGKYKKTNGTEEYGLLIRGKDGKTVMLDGEGIHNAGLTSGAVKDNVVADDANISGKKLDINSVIREVNKDGVDCIKGTKIQVGDRTLDVELQTQKNKVNENTKDLYTQKSEIKALDDQIKLKVDEQHLQQTKKELTDNLNNNLEQINTKFSKATSELNILKDSITSKVEKTDLESTKKELNGQISEQEDKINTVKSLVTQTADAIKQEISSINKDTLKTVDSLKSETTSKLSLLEHTLDSISASISSVKNFLEQKADKSELQKTESKLAELKVDTDEISAKLSSTQTIVSKKADKNEVEQIKTKLSELKIDSEGIHEHVEETEHHIDTIINGIEQIKDDLVYKVEIWSSNGAMFHNGIIDTELEAILYRGKNVVTGEFGDNQFRWTRISKDKEADKIWNKQHFGGTKSIHVTDNDVYARATFNVEVFDKSGTTRLCTTY